MESRTSWSPAASTERFLFYRVTGTGDCTDGSYNFPMSVFDNGNVIGPAITMTCTSCHTSGTNGAPIVTSSSTHVTRGKATGYNTFNDCTDCHGGHADGTTGVNDVEIPTTNAVFNKKYSSHGSGKIRIGGNATSTFNKSTEAEICWGCHQYDTYQGTGVDISEWDGTSATYNYGSVTANNLNWTTTSWTSPNFSYKNGLLNTHVSGSNGSTTATKPSTHAVLSGGVAGPDTVANISCAACHDVHGTHDNVSAGDPGGKPWIRGTWVRNPFPEDGAPQTTSHATAFGGVPRAGLGSSALGASPNAIGGWQIGQNNPGTYTSGQSYATFAGLCQNCHTETSLETAWAPHAYVVDGFNAGGGNNIFNTTKRGGNGIAQGSTARAHMQHNNTTPFDLSGQNGGYIYGLRNNAGTTRNAPWKGIAPGISPDKPEYAAMQNGWGISVDSSTVDANFHEFPCSKCHNPHASRLPRLSITNCLDVRHNSWDNAIDPSSGYWISGGGAGAYTANHLAYSSTAANCHRYVGSTDANRETNGSNETGWNATTPW